MHKNEEPAALLAEPLSVDVVVGEIVLDGSLPVAVSPTPDAAIETGVRLVNAGLEMDDKIA